MKTGKGVSRRWRWLMRLVAIAGSALALGVVFSRVNLEALVEALRTVRPGWYFLAHAAFGLGLLGSAIRWHLMMRLNPNAVVHAGASVRMVFMSQFFNTALGGPSAGDIPKTAMYSRWFGVPAAEVLAGSVLDRLVSTLGGLVFATAAVTAAAMSGGFEFLERWEWERPRPWMVWATAGVGVTVVGVMAWSLGRPESFLGRTLRTLGATGRRLVGSPRRSGQALLCSVLTAVLFNVTQVLCLQAVSAEPVPWLRLFWMYHVVTIVSALPVSVAGTGLREGASMVLLRAYGVAPATAVAAAMLTLSIHLAWAVLGLVLFQRERRLRRGQGRRPVAGTISVVIPTLNEEAHLPETIGRVRGIPEVREILVVDGGSTDGTVACAEALGCRVLTSVRGRGQQLRAGAEVATGDVVLLLHADTWVRSDAGAAIRQCLRDPLVVGGGFWKAFRSAPWWMRGSRIRCALRLWWNGRILGDQALFVRREVLVEVGGVPSQPLMEEFELCRRLRLKGRLTLAGTLVTTSDRRFKARGALRTYWLMWRVTRAYARGVSPTVLAQWYATGERPGEAASGERAGR